MKRCSISLIIIECDSKQQWNTNSNPLGWQLKKKKERKAVDEDMQKLEPLHIAGKDIKCL